MSLKVQVSSIIKAVIIALLLMQLSYTKLFGNWITLFSTSYNSIPLVLIYTCLIFITLVLCSVYRKRTKNKIISVECGIIIVAASIGIYNATSNNEFSALQAYCTAISYYYILLAIPLYRVLVCQKWQIKIMLNSLVKLCVGSYIIRAMISIWWSITGTVLIPSIALESAPENWIRNGVLRINPPCIGLLFLPIVFYLYIDSGSHKERLRYLIYGSLGVWYMVYVTQSRSMMIYQIIVLTLMILVYSKANKTSMITMIVVMISCVIFVNTPYFNNLMDSFSLSNTDTGSSTFYRKMAIVYFGEKYSQSPVWGLGFLNSPDQVGRFGGSIADIGFLGSIYVLGIFMVLFYILLFARGFFVSCKAKKAGNDKFIMILGMTVLILLTGINIDCFFGIFAFAVPFYIAIVEYTAWEVKHQLVLR